jgi:hypothetical protein
MIVNDISDINGTIINHIFYVKNTSDIKHAINMAHINKKKICIRGTSHCMGKHTLFYDGYLIDTKYFKHIWNINIVKKTVIVDSGLLWSNLIYTLNKYKLSPMILQSYSTFSIGGSISANIHGISSNYSIGKSIKWIELINYNCDIIKCSREQYPELFKLIIGGYGLFGVISRVKLYITDNYNLLPKNIFTNTHNFLSKFMNIVYDSQVKTARINIKNMNDINIYYFVRDNTSTKVISNINIKPNEMSYVSKILYKWVFDMDIIQYLRFFMENKLGKSLDLTMNNTSNNEISYESALPIAKLYSPFFNNKKTHVLQEYFIKIDNFIFLQFMDFLKFIFVGKYYNDITLLNITIRFIKKESLSYIKYAKYDSLAFVLYYRIKKNITSDNNLNKIHNLLVNKILELEGTFYLPYRLHYTSYQLFNAYPELKYLYLFKNYYDPYNIFLNEFYVNYLNLFKNYQINSY